MRAKTQAGSGEDLLLCGDINRAEANGEPFLSCLPPGSACPPRSHPQNPPSEATDLLAALSGAPRP